MINDIIDSMNELKRSLNNDEIFLSECDFQLNLAQKLINKDYNVILEYPIKKEKLYKYKKGTTDNNKDSNSYIDIFCKKDNKTYFIELKYKTVPESVKRYGDDFELKDHNCHTDNRYDVYKDIERLECCKQWYKDKYKKNSIGYVVFLTNYPKHHEPSSNQKKYPLSNTTKKNDALNLKINCEYKTNWYDFKSIGKSKFEYVLIKI